mgnify:CR=1 FL=1
MSDPRLTRPLVDEHAFDARYFGHSFHRPYGRDSEWLGFFDKIAERIASDIQPHTVLDAGCALGLLVETLRLRGIDARGLDVSDYAISHVHDSIKEFCRRGSVTETIGERYDLIVSIEVLEHMAPDAADAAIANFCAHSDDILFSSSPFDFGEATHVNVRPPEHWALQFARYGFFRDVDFDASFITSWAVRYRKRIEPVSRIVSEYERALSRLLIERNDLRAKALAVRTEINGMLEREGAMLEGEGALRERLAQAIDTIEHMERSLFWRARRPWAWLSRQKTRSK